MDIMIAFGVVSAVALILGIMLAMISARFRVEEDPLVGNLRECLPGVNCGACGYKGCDDYAASMAEGKAKPNLCIPGAKDVAQELAKVLGVQTEAPADMVAFVHCNGNCEATTKKATYDGIATCRAASMLYAGPDACRFGCMGYGDCAAACPANAICVKDGIAHIDSIACLGCGLCVSVCPKKVISLVPQSAKTVMMCNNKEKGVDARKACKNACIACAKCVKMCEQGAISVISNLAVIDYEKCNGCGACADACPTGALTKVFLPNA